jgi:alpha-L-arabinofuranosidase
MTRDISGRQERFRFIRRDDMDGRLSIHADLTEETPIPRRIFGNFFEHLGFSAQGGILAQLLMNPSLAAQHNLPAADLAGLLENGRIAESLHRLSAEERQAHADWRPHLRVTGFGLLILDDETEHGVPLPWKATPHGAVRGNQPGRIGHSVRISLNGGPVRLSQGIFPPHQRQRSYEGYVWARALGEGTLQVAIRRRPGADEAPLVTTGVAWPTERWTKIPFGFTLSEGALDALEPVDFCIEVEGNGGFWVDQAVLLPVDHVDGLDPDLLELCRWLAPPILRGPGGNFVSGYHFWQGIGPWDRRQTFPNRDWHGIDDNFFGTDEFLRLCELIGAEPHLCVNMGDGCAEEAGHWVEYINGCADSAWGARRAQNGHPDGYGVALWEVGNEIYGAWQIGHCGAEENARRYGEWATAMRNVDPSIELLATGSCFDFVEPEHQWHRILLEEGGETLESIALHALPSNMQSFSDRTPTDQIWRALMAHTLQWEKVDLPNLMALCEEVRPGSHIDIGITEWGILGRTDRPQVGNLGGAIYAGLFLNMAIRLKEWVRVANATALFHGGCLRKAGPFLYYDPQVEVIQRYTQLAGGTLLDLTYEGAGYDVRIGARTAPSVTDVPYIDAIAVRTQSGDVEMAIVSRHEQETVTLGVDIGGYGLGEPVSCDVMNADGPTRTNTPLAQKQVTFTPKAIPQRRGDLLEVEILPRSITWLRWG